MNTLGDLIRQKRKSKGLTLQQVAEAVSDGSKVAPAYISGIENDRFKPTFDRAVQILDFIGYDIKDLLCHLQGKPVLVEAPIRCSSVPVISSVQAGGWIEHEQAEQWMEWDTWVSAPLSCSKQSFGLRVTGDSMTSDRSGPSFPEGTIVIVDPSKEPTNKSFVVAMVDGTSETTFKQLVIESGRKYLMPLNRQFPLIECDERTIILGKVVDASFSEII